MKLDLQLTVGDNPLSGVAAMADAAQALGFAGLWTNETKHDAFLPLALAAARTETLQLGTSIAIAFARSPMTTAQIAWDLQEFSGGRLLLGLGTQVKAHIERRFGMPWDAPVSRLRDYIMALRAIWHSFQTDGRLDYRGQFYQHTLMTPFFNPGPIGVPEIPIHIAGVNTGLARLAGEICQGYHVHPFHSVAYVREVVRPAVAEGAARAGRADDEVELVTSAFVVTGSSAAVLAEQREKIRAQIAFYASTPTYRPVLEVHGWTEIGVRLSQLAKTNRWDEMPALISDEMLMTFAVEAAPDEVGPALRARYMGLIDRLSCYQPSFQPGHDDAFWRAILRSFQEA